MNLNKVTIAGHLTRDPEVQYTPKGDAVAKIAVAINQTYTQDGEKRTSVEYQDVTFWRNQAEVVGKHLKKGDPIFVEGKLKTEKWKDKQTGQDRSRVGIVAQSFQFVGKKSQAQEQAEPADEIPF